jgi:hypothetical protein
VKKRMLSRGRLIRSVATVDKLTSAGRYVFMWGRPLHPGFVQSLQLRVIQLAVTSKNCRQAVRNR